jgi:hypothetical protein
VKLLFINVHKCALNQFHFKGLRQKTSQTVMCLLLEFEIIKISFCVMEKQRLGSIFHLIALAKIYSFCYENIYFRS